MAEIKLTVQQQEVIDNRGGALLVSAAAGSGKTRVLIDRVLKRVAEEQCNVDDFLMITFTQAAATHGLQANLAHIPTGIRASQTTSTSRTPTKTMYIYIM